MAEREQRAVAARDQQVVEAREREVAEVVEILVDNGTPVEFGQVLMRVKPA